MALDCGHVFATCYLAESITVHQAWICTSLSVIFKLSYSRWGPSQITASTYFYSSGSNKLKTLLCNGLIL